MTATRYDAIVVGAGPAGSVAALVLARGGANVALVDKATFPRDKACGDLVGPRGVQVLSDLGLLQEVTSHGPEADGELEIRLGGDTVLAARRVGDMEVVGPGGRRVLLRSSAGLTYPGYGLAVPRAEFDAALRGAALAAGAEGITARAGEALFGSDGTLHGFRLERAGAAVGVQADAVIGADGALSRVGEVAGLVDRSRVLWAFAVRAYIPGRPALPRIVFWEPERWSGYPGYGWLFPGPGGRANVGLGTGARGDRRRAARAARELDTFIAAAVPGRRAGGTGLGGWLKLGMVGTRPAQGRTLLVGDAAGLVNPLQGEGIAQALGSGRAAAHCILSVGPGRAASAYLGQLAAVYAPYATSTSPLAAAMVERPRLVALLGRLLTAPGLGRAAAGGWALYWNDLLEGAPAGRRRQVAAVADVVARLLAGGHGDSRRLWESLGGVPPGWPLKRPPASPD